MHYRTIFISDTHLGGSCNVGALLDFFRNNDADIWYIIGDFIDFWAIKSWPTSHTTIIQEILRKARKGQNFVILPGNHDPQIRQLDGFQLGNVSVAERIVHVTSADKKYLILHGDIFDAVLGKALWLAKIGSVAYDILVWLNTSLNWIRKLFGMPFWSFSAAIKRVVKSAVSYVSDFENSLVELAQQNKMDGIICGHIHTPVYKVMNGIEYINTGDWVESLTAVVEHENGRLELMHYTAH